MCACVRQTTKPSHNGGRAAARYPGSVSVQIDLSASPSLRESPRAGLVLKAQVSTPPRALPGEISAIAFENERPGPQVGGTGAPLSFEASLRGQIKARFSRGRPGDKGIARPRGRSPDLFALRRIAVD